MSVLYDGEDELHYCDSSHRWIAPPGVYPDVWEAKVRAHMEEHLASMGGPPSRNARTRPVVPTQRQAAIRRNQSDRRFATARTRRTGTGRAGSGTTV